MLIYFFKQLIICFLETNTSNYYCLEINFWRMYAEDTLTVEEGNHSSNILARHHVKFTGLH